MTDSNDEDALMPDSTPLTYNRSRPVLNAQPFGTGTKRAPRLPHVSRPSREVRTSLWSKRRALVVALTLTIVAGAVFASAVLTRPTHYSAYCVDARVAMRVTNTMCGAGGSAYYGLRYVPEGTTIPSVGAAVPTADGGVTTRPSGRAGLSPIVVSDVPDGTISAP